MDEELEVETVDSPDELYEMLERIPGAGDLLATLMQTQFKDESDALVVQEALGAFMHAVRSGKVYRPELLN